MQNSENRGSLSDKFENFGAKPSEGLWDAVSAGLDAGAAAQPKRSTFSWKSLFWASAGFMIASGIAFTIWMTSSNGTPSLNNKMIAAESTGHSQQTNDKSTSETNEPLTTSSSKNGHTNTHTSTLTSDSENNTKPLPTTTQQITSSEKKNMSEIQSNGKKSIIAKNSKRRKNGISKNQKQAKELSKPTVKKKTIHRTTKKATSTYPGTISTQQAEVSNPKVNDTHLSDASNNKDNLPSNAELNGSNNPENLSAEGNDSEKSNDSLTASNSQKNDSSFSDSSAPQKPGSFSPPPPSRPAKWMLGGHVGATYGNAYLINFEQDQYISLEMLTNSTSKSLPAHLYWSADIQVSRRIGKRLWLESGLQGGMQLTTQEPNTDIASIAPSALQPVEGRVYNLGIPLAFRFDFKPKGKLQFYERIGTLHTFPYAVNARYISSNGSQPEKWMHYNYWTYTLSAYFNFGMEYPIRENLYWDVRTEVRFMKEMVSTHRNYDNTLWFGGSTGLVWKF